MPSQKREPSDVLSKSLKRSSSRGGDCTPISCCSSKEGLIPPQTNGILRSASTPPVLNALVLVQVGAVCSGGTIAGSVQARCSRSHKEPRRGGNWTPGALVPGYHCCHCTAGIFPTICTAFVETGKSLLAPLSLCQMLVLFFACSDFLWSLNGEAQL